MEQLLNFFRVEQCGLLEIQPDITQARLQHVVYEKGIAPVPRNVEYGALFPWTHARCVMQGEMFAQHSLEDLPPEAAIDRASAVALNLQTIVSLPVRRDGRTSHVLCMVSSRPSARWSDAVLTWARTIAETFLALLSRRAAEQESERLRAELRHADRVAHAGALTASLSHELSQPLAAILANAQAALYLLQDQGVNRAELTAVLSDIVRDDKRASDVVGNLRALLRREEPARAGFDLAAALAEVAALFNAELAAQGVVLRTGLVEGVRVHAVRTQVQQVMVNLIANALQSIRERTAGERWMKLSMEVIESRHAQVVLSDSGPRN